MRLIVSQPYDIRPPAAEQVVSYGGHEYRICWHKPAWYNTMTTLIVILAADEPQRFPYDGSLADPEQISTLWRVNYRGRSETMPHAPAGPTVADPSFDAVLRLWRELHPQGRRAMHYMAGLVSEGGVGDR
ncbi:MAG: hypothetical protein HGA45_31195 [Chloroflexales bacterium]|nr:hypothetical protein [Chloroflexales bacterium]